MVFRSVEWYRRHRVAKAMTKDHEFTHKKPTHKDIDAWFTKAFGHKPRSSYIQEWYGRFTSPRRAWSFSDYNRRKSLKKTFPHKFKGLSIKANLNNPEYQVSKYDRW